MKRSLLAAAAAVSLVGATVPAAATAKVIELGTTAGSPLVAPTCPVGVAAANCTIVLTRVTALETIRDGVTYPTTVTKPGYIVAFTLGLSKLDSNRAKAKSDIHFLDSTYGGVPQAQIAVLRKVGKASQRKWKLIGASSPPVHLIPYLGQVVQFPLTTALPVLKGDAIALTIPTWAPVLSIDLTANKYAYRQSRSTSCNSAASTPPEFQGVIGSTIAYGCNYPSTRVEYSATEVTNPTQTPNFVHAPDIPTKK